MGLKATDNGAGEPIIVETLTFEGERVQGLWTPSWTYGNYNYTTQASGNCFYGEVTSIDPSAFSAKIEIDKAYTDRAGAIKHENDHHRLGYAIFAELISFYDAANGMNTPHYKTQAEVALSINEMFLDLAKQIDTAYYALDEDYQLSVRHEYTQGGSWVDDDFVTAAKQDASTKTFTYNFRRPTCE